MRRRACDWPVTVKLAASIGRRQSSSRHNNREASVRVGAAKSRVTACLAIAALAGGGEIFARHRGKSGIARRIFADDRAAANVARMYDIISQLEQSGRRK